MRTSSAPIWMLDHDLTIELTPQQHHNMASRPELEQLVITDGSMDWSDGVNSDAVSTIQSERNPNGLKRTQVAWMNNGTVRGGCLIQRNGWDNLGSLPINGKFQGQLIYKPDLEDPYLIIVIDGHVIKAPFGDVANAEDLSVKFDLILPITERVFFCQAEQFLVIQAGDGVTLPLFWDGSILRRSLGLLGSGALNSAAPLVYELVLTNVDVPVNTIFPAQSSASNVLGVPYEQFAAPALAANVTVTLSAAYAGIADGTANVAFPINETGAMQMTGVTVVNPTLFYYTYTNGIAGIGIVPGSLVPAQFAPGSTPGTGANFIAFTAPAYGGNIVFAFTTPQNTGPANSWYWPVNHYFTVVSTTVSELEVQNSVSEIPSATAMCYYMGRLWYAQNRQYAAGDIVGGTYGTAKYEYRDAVLKVTENPLCIGGDGFKLPSGTSNIRAIAYTSNINAQLGQGSLYVGTREEIFQLTVPVNRTDWINSGKDTSPLQVVALSGNGWASDRSIVSVNGDLFFQSLEPSIRSLTVSVRNFQQWGNVPISINEERILAFNNRDLLRFGSGIYFNNRMLQTALPFECPAGVAHAAIIPLNFDTISNFENVVTGTRAPSWEGMWEGLSILQLSDVDFGGRKRAFATAWSEETQSIQVWELTDAEKWDNNGQNRVSWYIEFPAFTWGNERMLKKLAGCELWLDSLLGEVMFNMEYRPDGDPCWYPWHQWKFCTAKDSCENVHNPVCTYPANQCESYRQMVSLPTPPRNCAPVMGRPSNVGYQFQCRLTVLGWCRIRGLFLHAEQVSRKLYDKIVC